MDGQRFDALTRSLARATASRRLLLTGAAATALGPLAATLGVADTGATHFECRHVGERCRRGRQCCSSKCRNNRCKAHHVGGCEPQPGTCVNSATCGNNVDCLCATTTGGAGYCSNGTASCTNPPCTTDKDCEEATGIKGAACLDCPSCTTTGGKACAFPCPTL